MKIRTLLTAFVASAMCFGTAACTFYTTETSETSVAETAEVTETETSEETVPSETSETETTETETEPVPLIEEYSIDEDLIGTWVWSDEGDDDTYTYTFNDDNTGTMSFSFDGNEFEFDLTYSAGDHELLIVVDGVDELESATYVISDDVLTVTTTDNQSTLDMIRSAE